MAGRRVTTDYYPPAISSGKPGWLNSVNNPFWRGGTRIEKLLKEVYSALHNDCMIEQVGEHGSIGENVKRSIWRRVYCAKKVSRSLVDCFDFVNYPISYI
jgi:hypothetical protein